MGKEPEDRIALLPLSMLAVLMICVSFWTGIGILIARVLAPH